MIRPCCFYLSIAAVFLLAVGLFLPAGRGLNVLSYSSGQVIGEYEIEAEEMGCLTVPPAVSAGNTWQVYMANPQSFFSSSSVLCGKSPLSMLLSGKYLLANAMLFLPFPLALFAVWQVLGKPYARNSDKRVLLLAGSLAVVILLMWWTLWVKFRALPGIGFWVSLLGATLLLAAGLLAQNVDPFRERHHPHPA